VHRARFVVYIVYIPYGSFLVYMYVLIACAPQFVV